MKKILILSIIALSALSFSTTAQVQQNMIGVRLGYGAEVSFQHDLKNLNRLEFDLGWNSDYFAVAGLYQWMFDLSQLQTGFNWYTGVGASLGSHSSDFSFGISGNVGIEYNFQIPIQVSLDWRPTFYLVPGTDFSATNIGLGVRYRF